MLSMTYKAHMCKLHFMDLNHGMGLYTGYNRVFESGILHVNIQGLIRIFILDEKIKKLDFLVFGEQFLP